MKLSLIILLVIVFAGCNSVTSIPKGKKNQLRETPSILILERIVEFRENQLAWPVSREDFISKGIRYYEVFENFPYQQTRFKITDSNTMTFYFYDHIKDKQRYEKTKHIDLNSYGGHVKFFKENEKFIWKLKMD